MDSHIEQRRSRYDINSKTSSFTQSLKGLAVIELCITELCTRRCVFCPRGDPSVYPSQKLFMLEDTVHRIGQQCKDAHYECDFHFSGFGESFTHPHFFKLLSILRSYCPDNYICLTTNGDMLNDNRLDQLNKLNVSKIIVSCYDGPAERDEFIKLFERTGTKNYEIRELWFHPNEDVTDLISRNNFNNRSGAVSAALPLKNQNSPCYLPFYKLVIDWDGTALICCNDWFRVHKGFGNINTATLPEIWFGTEFTSVRAKLSCGDRSSPACSRCNIGGTLVGKESVDILS